MRWSRCGPWPRSSKTLLKERATTAANLHPRDAPINDRLDGARPVPDHRRVLSADEHFCIVVEPASGTVPATGQPGLPSGGRARAGLGWPWWRWRRRPRCQGYRWCYGGGPHAVVRGRRSTRDRKWKTRGRPCWPSRRSPSASRRLHRQPARPSDKESLRGAPLVSLALEHVHYSMRACEAPLMLTAVTRTTAEASRISVELRIRPSPMHISPPIVVSHRP